MSSGEGDAGRGVHFRYLGLLVLATAVLPVPTVLALHFRDGPPARVTGGFDEDSCVACHAGQPVNDAEGRLALTGFPERFKPGETYEIELVLSRPRLQAAGFQLAVRRADDRSQAGQIRVPADDESRIGLLDERGVQFAHQRLPESAPAGDARVVWKMSWTAPDARERVVLHAAAVSANGDDSELGDHVYTLEAATEPAAP